jgi:hypothetical protein
MTVRIGCGIAFWGDDITAPRRLLERAPLDYLVMDFLAELTMAILQKQRSRNPGAGYARDVVDVVDDVLDLAIERGTRIVTNAGGINAIGCARTITDRIKERGASLRVAAVLGDDVLGSLPSIAAADDLSHLDNGPPFSDIAHRVVSANVYLGASGIAQALGDGADIVICGRVTDTALTLGPLIREFGWADDDWDRLAAGIVAGHLIECTAQVTGGYHQGGWQDVSGLELLGYPYVEVEADGTFVLTKPEGTGGLVSNETVTEQLLYEIGDPARFMTPDVVVDLTQVRLETDGPDRVRVTGCAGNEKPEKLKATICYSDGWSTVLTWPYTAPDAVAKAEAALRKIAASVERLGLELDGSRADIFGAGAVHGPRAPRLNVEPPEVFARFAARSRSRETIRRLSIEKAPGYLGPPGQAGHIAGGRGQISEVVSFWPTLIDRAHVRERVQIMEVDSEAVAT